MQTKVDIDADILKEAQRNAQEHGISLDALVEESLRAALKIDAPTKPSSAEPIERIDADDAFFQGLEDIRKLGHVAVAKQPVDLT